jgi:hypothetical protein
MTLAQFKQKPTVFLSFASEDVEWKMALMDPKWWAALTKIAEVYDYDDNPSRFGDLSKNMDQLIKNSSAFIVLLSKYYIRKDSAVLEREFTTAVDCFSDPGRHDLFRVIIIDPDAKQWWDVCANEIFRTHEWLQKMTYWELIEGKEPALLNGQLKTRYARDVRDYAEKLAASILACASQKTVGTLTTSGSIIVLGHPRTSPVGYTRSNLSIVNARQELACTLRARDAKVSEWDDAWLENKAKRESLARELRGSVDAVVRPLGPDEAFDYALSPDVITNQMQYIMGPKVEKAEIAKIRMSLWLPSQHRNDPQSQLFVQNADEQPDSANPRLCIATPQEVANLLVPQPIGGKIRQISIEELDDIKEIESGRTARKIVEDELRKCFMDSARQANIEIQQPLFRQFLNYQRLANQIAETTGSRMMLVAHDLQEHRATSPAEAHLMICRKLRNLRESIEVIITPSQGQIIPITLIVTNYLNLQNDFVLDEEIAGTKWWVLPGQFAAGKFTPERDVYAKIVKNIAKMLQ